MDAKCSVNRSNEHASSRGVTAACVHKAFTKDHGERFSAVTRNNEDVISVLQVIDVNPLHVY